MAMVNGRNGGNERVGGGDGRREKLRVVCMKTIDSLT